MNKSQLMKVNTDSGEVELSVSIIRNQIARGSNISDAEIMNFIMLCKYRKLNPFLGQAYLVKFKDQAEMIVGKDVFTQRLNQNQLCNGWETGVIVLDKKKDIVRRPGTFMLDTDTLVGAYCTIEREGWKKPFDWTISFKDYYRTYTKNGKTLPMGNWGKMPAVMLVKCAMVSCVRNVFPESFGGMYDADEIGVDMTNVIDVEDKDIKKLKKVNAEDIEKIKEAAKSKDEAADKSFDSKKLIDYAINSLKKRGDLAIDKIEELNAEQVNDFIKVILGLVKAKEQQFHEKNGIEDNSKKADDNKKSDKKEEKVKDVSNFEEMPIVNDFAKPADGGKTDEKK